MQSRSLARQFFWWQATVVLAMVLGAIAFAVWDTRSLQLDRATTRALHVAKAVADVPMVGERLARGENEPALQAYTERVRLDTGVDFIVIMTPDGIRWTHTDPHRIGEHFVGERGQSAEGVDYTGVYAGTLGPSARAVVPVWYEGRVVGMVSVGIVISRIVADLPVRLLLIGLAAAVLLTLGGVASYLLALRLGRQTHGMDETELARMYEYYDSVLHAVREGLVLLDPAGQVQLVNDEGRRLLDLVDKPVVGKPLAECGLPPNLVTELLEQTTEADELYVVGSRVLVVNQAQAEWRGDLRGSVVTFRDHTELQRVTGELATIRGLTETLRSQNHEAANRLHTVVSLIELGHPQDAVQFVVGELDSAQRLADQLTIPGEGSIVAALLLGKTAQASQEGIDLQVDEDSLVTGTPISAGDMVTIIGNLVDNAFEAVEGCDERLVGVFIHADESRMRLEVEDSGPGVPPTLREQVFARGWTSKGLDQGAHGLGLALVQQVVHKHAGSIQIGDSGLGGAAFIVDIESRGSGGSRELSRTGD